MRGITLQLKNATKIYSKSHHKITSIYIEQCHKNSEYIYGSNEPVTEKTIASLKNNKVIVSKINETKAKEIIHQEFKHQFQEMIRRITEKMKQTFPNIP